MRTQALRVTVGAYSDGSWHTTLVEDEYERGVLKNSQLISALHTDDAHIRQMVNHHLSMLIASERNRLRLEEQGADPGDTLPAPPGGKLRATA